MNSARSETYRSVAEAGWRWTLDQVHWDDGPWVPASVRVSPDSSDASGASGPPKDRDGMYDGIGGLAYALAEVRLTRPWNDEEAALADGIVSRLDEQVGTSENYTMFDGLASHVGALGALVGLDAPGASLALTRLASLATPDGWAQSTYLPSASPAGTRLNDLTLGTAGVLLVGAWGHRAGVAGADVVADLAADVLMAEEETSATGSDWPFIARRFRPEQTLMPNLSHGVAGVAAALALAGRELDRPDLTAAAVRGAEHLISLGDSSGKGFVVQRYIPSDVNDEDDITFTWCHGAAGTSLLFAALDYAGVGEVAGRSPRTWRRRCLESVRRSGIPERRYPGFWDNDGRCCGTAGVGDVFLDAFHHDGRDPDLSFALVLADALVERAIRTGPCAYWRFVEHRRPEPLLPPRVGWMQGAAGISAFLFGASRVAGEGRHAKGVARLDNWWAL